jgi:hypothetical protein
LDKAICEVSEFPQKIISELGGAARAEKTELMPPITHFVDGGFVKLRRPCFVHSGFKRTVVAELQILGMQKLDSIIGGGDDCVPTDYEVHDEVEVAGTIFYR